MTIKEKMHDIIEQQPDDSSFDEILKELFFNRMIQRGIDDVKNNRVFTEEEVEREINSW